MSQGLEAAIERLAEFNDDPDAGGVTREVFTPTYRRALDWVDERMRRAGMETRLDAFGNLWGRWEGRDSDAPRVITGSHIDTTLNAGRYDGVVGVLGGIEAVRAIRAEGLEPRHPIEIVAFAGEEPRFGSGCIGSRAIIGALASDAPERMRDRDGVTLAQALNEFGLAPERIGEAQLDPATVHSFVELHIEQGLVLETHGEQIGVVTAIAAPHDFRLILRGAATHSGATPMALRRDALAGAAEVMTVLERLARESASGTTVGTVGVLRVRPGAINVVPGAVELDVDVRDSDLGAREAVVQGLLDAARRVADRRGLSVEVDPIVEDTPVQCEPDVVAAAEEACEALGLSFRRMVSGAYHDAMILGAAVPIGMVFVPSRGGISHHPDEYTAPEQLDAGVRVLARVLARLAAPQKPSR
jgi:hydantoinase/carbamoylase family amidase